MSTREQRLSLALYQGGKGLPESTQKALKGVSVYGNDLDQIHNMILYAPETYDYLKQEYSPTAPTYRKGIRPSLEDIATRVIGDYKEQYEPIQALLSWVSCNVQHALVLNGDAPVSYLSEEDIIERGWGWCNEQARVFACLAQTCNLMTRMCFLTHKNATWGHVVTEVYFENEWIFADPTIGIMIRSVHNSFLTIPEIQNVSLSASIFDHQYRCAQIQSIERWTAAINDGSMKPDDKAKCIKRMNEEKHTYRYDSKLLTYACVSNYTI